MTHKPHKYERRTIPFTRTEEILKVVHISSEIIYSANAIYIIYLARDIRLPQMQDDLCLRTQEENLLKWYHVVGKWKDITLH